MRNGFCVLLPIGYLCAMKKLFTTIYITLLCLDCMAQRQTVVADMDTRTAHRRSCGQHRRRQTPYHGLYGTLRFGAAHQERHHLEEALHAATCVGHRASPGHHLPHSAGGGAQRRGGDGARIQLQYAEGAAERKGERRPAQSCAGIRSAWHCADARAYEEGEECGEVWEDKENTGEILTGMSTNNIAKTKSIT